MEKELQEIEDQLLQSDSGRAFLEAYKVRVISGVTRAFATAVSEVEDLSPDALSNADILGPGQSDVFEVAQVILDKINTTREELKSISEMATERNQKNYNAVGDELAAITQDTEEATNSIMDAVDGIEGLLKKVHGGAKISEEVLKDIFSKTGDIVVACSFQDITSQRVQKVVDVLQAIDMEISRIESRLNSPVASPIDQDVIDSEEFSREQQKRDGLLDGPALPSSAASQEDIDSLFDDV